MKTALVDSNGIVKNLIVAGVGYTPPDGCTVQDINNWLNPGDNISAPEPVAAPLIGDALSQATKVMLEDIDKSSARAMRSIILALVDGKTPVAADINKLQSYEIDAETLRNNII